MSDRDISKLTPNSEITIYETEDGKVKIEVYFANENLWLSQRLMAELFECSTSVSVNTYTYSPKPQCSHRHRITRDRRLV